MRPAQNPIENAKRTGMADRSVLPWAKRRHVRESAVQDGDTDTLEHFDGCLNDLMAVIESSAQTLGKPLAEVVPAVLDALVHKLNLDFAYARVEDGTDDLPVEIVRSRGRRKIESSAVGRALDRWIRSDRQSGPIVAPNPIGSGTVSIVLLPLGLHTGIGVIAAASSRSDFPTQCEALLLRVAKSQATVLFQEARLARERQRVAQELEHHVADRTEQLRAANRKLTKEVQRLRQSQPDAGR